MTEELTGNNAQREIDHLAELLTSITLTIEPLATPLEATKTAIRAHAPCAAHLPIGAVTVARPPAQAAPKTVYTVAPDLDPRILAAFLNARHVVASTPKPKRAKAAVSITPKWSAV